MGTARASVFAGGALSRGADPARRLADELAKSFDELGFGQARRGRGPDLARRDARAAFLVFRRELGHESIPDRAGSDDQDVLVVRDRVEHSFEALSQMLEAVRLDACLGPTATVAGPGIHAHVP